MNNSMRFHHISMDVDNYDACMKFYKALGLEKYCSWAWQEDGPDYKKGFRNCFLALHGEPVMELHEVQTPNRPQGILSHWCLMADTDKELDELYQAAVKAGAKTLAEPFVTDLMCEPRPIPGARVANLLGPAGEQIELLCWHGWSR